MKYILHNKLITSYTEKPQPLNIFYYYIQYCNLQMLYKALVQRKQ